MKKTIILFLINLIFITTQPVVAFANENIQAADVVILVDFSGSITSDPRYPLAERKALENLVNVTWPKGSRLAILAFGAADSRNGGKPSTFPMCNYGSELLMKTEKISEWIGSCVETIGTEPVGPNTDHNKAIKKAVEILSGPSSINTSKFILLMTDGKLDVDNLNPVNPDYTGTSAERDKQAIDELFLEVLPDARQKGIQVWPVGFGNVNRIELNGYAPEGGQPGPDSCQLEIPRAVIAEPEDLPYEINKIIRQVTCLGEYIQGENVEVQLPGYADSATVNVKHDEGESFKLLGPNGEEINGGGQGTESTIEISNPSEGSWQVISDSALTVGYWWESSFEPVIECPESDNVVSISIAPSNNLSESYVDSPVFEVEVIVDGKKEIFELELGEIEELLIEGEYTSLTADAKISSLDQPGIIDINRVQAECENNLAITTTSVPNISQDEPKEEVVIENLIDCELVPDNTECKEPLDIPWWLILLLFATLIALIWYFWNKRFMKEGTFVFSNNQIESGRVRVPKKTRKLAFLLNQNEMVGSQVDLSSPEIYGSYEVKKGKKGADFVIDGPTGGANKHQRSLIIGETIELEDGFFVEFEDGKNRKPVVNNFEDPFGSESNTDQFDTTDSNFEEENGSTPFG